MHATEAMHGRARGGEEPRVGLTEPVIARWMVPTSAVLALFAHTWARPQHPVCTLDSVTSPEQSTP